MRWLAMFCFSAAGAILALQYGGEWTALGLCALALVFIVAGALRKKKKRLAALTLALGIAFGSCYTLVYDIAFVRPALRYAGTEQTVTVTIASLPQKHTYGAKCEALFDAGALAPVKVQLYGDEILLGCVPGDRIVTEAKLQDASNIRGETLSTFTAKGKRLLIYSRGEPEIQRAEKRSLRWLPFYLNMAVQEKIGALYTGDARILMKALLTGDRTEFDDTFYSLLSETGVTHVTAVSGMHCAFLFGMVRLLVRNKRRATLIGIPVLFLFMLMVGAAPSVMRACFMLTLLSAAPLLNRENDSPTTLSLALLLILLRNPYAAASIGLQLSFLSVAGILLFSERLYQAMKKPLVPKGKRRTVLCFVLSALATTCAASVFTIPLAAYYFGCVSLVSPLTNLLCLGAVSFAFCGGFITVLLGFAVMPAAAVAAIFPAAALDYFMAVVHLSAGVPYHAIYTANPYLGWWLLYFYAMIALVLLTKNRRRRTVVTVASLSLSTLCLVIALPILANGRARLTASVLDVGQGESILLTSGKEAVLVDCGSSNSWINAGSVAANAANTLGYRELDHLILTHYHSDHANGLETLFSRIKVRRLIAPGLHDEENLALQREILTLAEQYGTEVTLLEEERSIPLGETTLRLLPPMGGGSTNEEGLSLLCSCADFDMLITGDMDRETEQELMASADLPDLEVLVAGHHGSKHSTSRWLLEDYTPETAVIPVGSNSYGHPAPETLRRLYEAGVDVRRTDRGGTVTVTVY